MGAVWARRSLAGRHLRDILAARTASIFCAAAGTKQAKDHYDKQKDLFCGTDLTASTLALRGYLGYTWGQRGEVS